MDYTPPPFEDNFTVEKLFCQGYSYTYDDVIFLPHYIDFPTDVVQLSTILHSTKLHRVPILSSPVFKPPSKRIESLDYFGDSPYVLVTQSGTSASKLLGYVSKLDWQKLDNKEVKIYDYMVNLSDSLSSSFDLGQIYSFLEEKKSNFMPLMNDDEVLDLVTKEDVERIKGYLKLVAGSIGADGKWLVGTSIGTRCCGSGIYRA